MGFGAPALVSGYGVFVGYVGSAVECRIRALCVFSPVDRPEAC